MEYVMSVDELSRTYPVFRADWRWYLIARKESSWPQCEGCIMHGNGNVTKRLDKKRRNLAIKSSTEANVLNTK